MCGAKALYLSVGLIIEEGMKTDDLKRILHSMAEAAKKACVQIVTGDTKVVPKGKVDKIFINTSGIGLIREGVNVSGDCAPARRQSDCLRHPLPTTGSPY